MAPRYTVGMFMNLGQDDEHKKMRRPAFSDGLRSMIGDDLDRTRFIVRHADGDFVTQEADDSDYNKRAKELVGCNVRFASCRPTLKHILKQFPNDRKTTVVAGMFYPGVWTGNDDYFKDIRGFVSYDLGIVLRWLDLLQNVFKAIGKTCTKIGVITDSRTGANENPGAGRIFGTIDANTPLDVEPIPIDKGIAYVKTILDTYKKTDNGIIVPALTLTAINRKALIDYINDNIKVPVIYPNQLYVGYPDQPYTTGGGLISLGVDLKALYTEAGKVAGALLLNQSTSALDLWHGPSPMPAGYKILQVALNLDTARSKYGYSSTMVNKLADLADIFIGDQ
jgi:hypothetical protein